MDSSCNPFSPDAGSRPPAFVGREEVLREADTLIGRLPRRSLIAKGMIYSPRQVFVAFTVPLFAEYLRRQCR